MSGKPWTEEQKQERRKLFTGEGNPNWKGGRQVKKGYIYIYAPNHPHCTKEGYVLEHRLMVEKQIGRYLLPSETIHHKNKKRTDNQPENLPIMDNHSHPRLHHKGKKKPWFKGKHHTPEHNAKIGESLKGKTQSKEHRDKRIASLKATLANKRRHSNNG